MKPTDVDTERKQLPPGHKPWPKRDMAEDWADFIAEMQRQMGAKQDQT